MKRNKFEIDMCNGSIMDKLISFSLPLMLTSILQLMFNAVDIIVVGRFSGSQALAAVGSTTALINIFTNLFIGISLGANVLAARYYAAGRDKEMSEAVHTAIALACQRYHYGLCRSGSFQVCPGAYGYSGGRHRSVGTLYEDLFHGHALFYAV